MSHDSSHQGSAGPSRRRMVFPTTSADFSDDGAPASSPTVGQQQVSSVTPTHTPRHPRPRLAFPALDPSQASGLNVLFPVADQDSSAQILRSDPTSRQPMIEVRDVRYTVRFGLLTNIAGLFRKGFRKHTVSVPYLDIYPGELIALMGENGAGKSILMKLLALQLQPKHGSVRILGGSLRREELRGGAITYIPQRHFGLRFTQSPFENVRSRLIDWDGLPGDEATQRAQNAIEVVCKIVKPQPLDPDKFRDRLRNLSGGERAFVAVAKAYAAERPILLADETLAPLTPQNRHSILRLFQELAAQGYTIILIVHEEGFEDYFHRVIRLGKTGRREGGIVSDRTNAVVQTPPN